VAVETKEKDDQNPDGETSGDVRDEHRFNIHVGSDEANAVVFVVENGVVLFHEGVT